MTGLTIILIVAASMVAVAVLSILAWLLYGLYLNRLERQLAVRKGFYRDLVAGLASRDHALLGPELLRADTLHDFEALEAVLEEQARSATERPTWLLDAYDRLGLVDKYIQRLLTAKQWRERAFAAELLGRVGNAKAVPALLETVQATRTEDADVREIALRALARIADLRAVPPLIEALKQVEVWLAPRVADILVRHGEPVIGPMIAFLEEPTRHPARAWAANILGELKAARAFPILVRTLGDLDDEVRAKSAAALGKLGDRRAVTYLLDHLLSDPAPFVRARIAGALGQFNEPEVIDRLVRALGDPAWWVRMRSVEALEQIGAVAEKPLLLALDDPDAEIRIRAAVALERLGVPARVVAQIDAGTGTADTTALLVKFGVAGARELLAEELAHPSPRVRQAVIEAIQQAGRRDLADDLATCVRFDSDPTVRAAALEALRGLGIKSVVPSAIEALGDPDLSVRAAATQLVGELGDANLGEQLRPRTADPEPVVRAAAARAVGLIRARGAEADIVKVLRDPVAAVRVAAAEGAAFGEWRGTVPWLTDLLGDTELEVRIAAARALGSLGDPAAAPALLRAFREPNADLRDAVTTAVANVAPDALPGLVDIMLEDNDVASRLAVVRASTQIRASQSLRLLQSLWVDRSPTVRAAAGQALGRMGDPEGAVLLEPGLQDPDERVRAAAVDGLVRLQRDQAGPAILRLVQEDPSPQVRERAALAVGLFQVPGGEVELLRLCTADQSLVVRAAAALAIGVYDQESIVARVVEMADEEALRELLRERLKDDSEYRLLARKLRTARHIELRALAAPTREQMQTTLAEGMRAVLNPAERIRLVAGLRAFQGDRSRGALLQVLRSDPSPEVRAAALTAVGGFLEADELLFTARRGLSDPHRDVRGAAVALFSRVPPEQALPSLIRVLHADDDPAILQAVAAQADAAFEVFLDLALGLTLDRKQGVIVAQTARYIHHPGLRRLLPNLARSQAAEVREAVAILWAQRPELIDDASLAHLSEDPSVPVRHAAARAWKAGRRFDRLEAMLEDPDPGLRREVAIGLLEAPVSAALKRLEEDPDPGVSGTAFVVRVLRGETTKPPARLLAEREQLVEAARLLGPAERLSQTALGDPDPRRRVAAALVLAILDDAAAHRVMRDDPVRSVRDQVARMLKLWQPQ